MQFLLINKSDTLITISRVIGAQNIEVLLTENGLKREPKIGEQWNKKCDDLLATQPNDIPPARKSALLNSLVDSEEVFEKACLMDEDEWKIFSAFQAFRDALRIPESIRLPYSTRVIGAALGDVVAASLGNVSGSRSRTLTSIPEPVGPTSTSGASVGNNPVEPVSSATYRKVMQSLKQSGHISPAVFNTVNTSFPVSLEDSRSTKVKTKTPQYSYNLPWGQIQLYSSLIDEIMDIPAYPEEVETSRSATYTQMPDIIYQYEPWIVYENSGPRVQTLNFHLHRDLWTGNHLDGNANKLIRFCEANTFPEYNGSNVHSPIVRLYINGSLFIGGVLTRTDVNWRGPIGLDNWYLDFDLSLTIQEVSDMALNINSVRSMGLIGT